MMVLEVIVGSELVLPIKTYEETQQLVLDIMGHIPAPTYRLINQMLFEVRDKMAVEHARDAHMFSAYDIHGAIKGMEKAKMSNPILKRRCMAFEEYSASNAEDLRALHYWHKDLHKE